MFAKRVSASRVLAAHSPGTWSLLPFLYHTRSISKGPVIPTRPHNGVHRERGGRRKSKSPRGEANTAQERSRTAQRDKFSALPFGRPLPRKDPYAELELEGSTVTPNERKAFESLFSLRPRADVARAQSGSTASNAAGLSDLLEPRDATAEAHATQRPELPAALKTLLQDVRTVQSVDGQTAAYDGGLASLREIKASTLSPTATKELDSVSKAMDAAETDSEVWNALQSRVLGRLATIFSEDTLQVAASKINRKQETRQTSNLDEKGDLHADSSPSKGKQTLAQTLPYHLVRTMQRLTADFPASSLPLAILPMLKSLGSSTFALGSSTKLYNVHMRLLYERYNELRAIVDVLTEMEAGAHETDDETLELVDDILIFAQQAERGEKGAAVQVLWRMERMQGPLALLADWRRTLVRKSEDKALRLARERDAYDGGSAGSALEM